MRAALDKDRDIARSILPSRRRRLSRVDIPAARRRARRSANAEVREAARWVRRGLDGWLDYEGDPMRYDDEVPALVRQRRQGDKLNHFERWAVMRTRDVPVEDRMATLRRVLPDTLPGRHALGHLDDLPVLGRSSPRTVWWQTRLRLDAEHSARAATARGRRRAGLLDALVHGEVADLNRSLRAGAEVDGVEPVLLRGPDDVESLLVAATRGGALAHRRLDRALDDAVPGWRRLAPLPAPEGSDPVVPPLPVRQSWAAGLSWLEGLDGGASAVPARGSA